MIDKDFAVLQEIIYRGKRFRFCSRISLVPSVFAG